MSNIPLHWTFLTDTDLESSVESLRASFAEHVEYSQGKDEWSVTRQDFFESLARSCRDRLLDRWNRTQQRLYAPEVKRVYYLSLEYLMGRLLRDSLDNLGILENARKAMESMDVNLDEALECEPDAGLGNGGLGRLAACFLDSMATLGLPATGCGIRYEYGIFKQGIEDGQQVEIPDNWLRYGSPWELPRPLCLYPVRFGGWVQSRTEPSGRLVFDWIGAETVMAMAHDYLVPGYRCDTVNTLRLWAAKASREFDLANFNQGDYVRAVHEKNATENITRVLYPADNTTQGKELRLKQECFFVSATLQDAMRRQLKQHGTVHNLHEKNVFQLNDTHPALAVPELMRLLLDDYGLDWEEAWNITRHSLAYTNHTVLPEALEVWSVAMMSRLLPRHLQIIYEINARFLAQVEERWPGDEQRLQHMSIVGEAPEKHVRMANLAIVGSFSVNGVSELHSNLLKTRIFPDFYALWPERFSNKTNGITPRRWMMGCNPGLSDLVSSRIGDGWRTDLRRLRELEPHADDPEFRAAWRDIKRKNKIALVRAVERECGIAVDLDSLFDVQVKRIHEYKRQLLNILYTWSVARRIRRAGAEGMVPRTVLFGGKAAPGYAQARSIVRLILAVANRVNRDPRVNPWLRVVFFPDYRVTAAEVIIPAADLSEQISTAGMEASGTGNMKLSLNGALTIGTMDGANIEILEAVGAENMFIFGLDEPGAAALKGRGYDPWETYRGDADLRDTLDSIARGDLCPDEPDRFRPVVDRLLSADPFLILTDFAAYRLAHARVAKAWTDPEDWTRRSILTTARMGGFSSDLTIQRYADEIWKVKPCRA